MLITDLSMKAQEFLEIISLPIITFHNRHKESLKITKVVSEIQTYQSRGGYSQEITSITRRKLPSCL